MAFKLFESVGSLTLPLSREARAGITRGPSRLERDVSVSHSSLGLPAEGRHRHHPTTPPLDPRTDQSRRSVSSATVSRPMSHERAADRVPLAATPTPPRSTMLRTTTSRSPAHQRVEVPEPMTFQLFEFLGSLTLYGRKAPFAGSALPAAPRLEATIPAPPALCPPLAPGTSPATSERYRRRNPV